ncbi:unnamed protein product [Sphagnum balticum]
MSTTMNGPSTRTSSNVSICVGAKSANTTGCRTGGDRSLPDVTVVGVALFSSTACAVSRLASDTLGDVTAFDGSVLTECCSSDCKKLAALIGLSCSAVRVGSELVDASANENGTHGPPGREQSRGVREDHNGANKFSFHSQWYEWRAFDGRVVPFPHNDNIIVLLIRVRITRVHTLVDNDTQ